MGMTLRVTLLIVSVLTGVWILSKIRRNHVKQEDALFWICFAALLALLGIFPQIAYFISNLFGIMSPANFVFLMVIGLLVEKIFSLSIQTSRLESQLEIMSAELALRTKVLGETAGASPDEKEVKEEDVTSGAVPEA